VNSAPKAPRWIEPLLLVALLSTTAALFWQTLDYPFLRWDDGIYVTQRPTMRQVAYGEAGAITRLLTPGEALDRRFWEFYPLRDLSYALDAVRAGGLDSAAPFRQTNLAIHLLNLLLVFVLGRRLGLGPLPAAAASCFFGVHPLVVEPVAWISARKELLYTALALVSLVVWLRPRRGALAAGGFTIASIGAMASKGPGVIVVPIAAWLRRRNLSKPEKRLLLALAIVAAAWVALALEIGRRNGVVVHQSALFPESIWRAVGAPIHAASQILFPVALSPSYVPWPERAWLDPYCWAGVLLAVLLFLVRRRAVASTSEWTLLGCFLLALLPTSGIVPVAQLRADRFLYLALAFAALLLGHLLRRGVEGRRWLWAAPLLVLPLLAWQSRSYARVWRSEVTLWKHVLRQEPDHPLANGSLAAHALAQGRFDVAKPLLDRTLRLDPESAVAWSNLGRYWLHEGGGKPDRRRLAAAERAFRRAARLDPRFPAPRVELARIAARRGDRAAAQRLLREALSLPRCPPEAATLLGDLLWRGGRKREAREVVQAYCRERPGLQRCSQWLTEHHLATTR
jgi:tetratricopeptide (TPR) repeat protein